MGPPAPKNIIISQGIDFSYSFLMKNAEDNSVFDLTGYTAAAKVRTTPDSPTILLAFSCSISTPASGGPVIITSTTAANSGLALGIYHWDCIVTHATAPDIKLLKGKATVEATASS